jgi:hypothetical protein
MRLRENEIELVARCVQDKLMEAGCLELETGEEELCEKIKNGIVADLMVEDNLNREVEEILREHMNDIQGGSIDYRKMFAMIKKKLARDRNLILS